MQSENLLPDFLIIPSQIVMDQSLHPLDGYVYGVVYWYTKLRLEKCIASSQTIGKILRVTQGATQNAINRLVKKGYIKSVYDRKSHKRELIPMVTFRSKEEMELVGTTSTDVMAPHQLTGSTTSTDVSKRARIGTGNKNTKEEDFNNILAKPNLKTKRANVEKSVDNPRQRLLLEEETPKVSGKVKLREDRSGNGMISLSDAIASARPMFEATMQITPDKNITTEHQAYGLMVSEHLSLPSFYNARIIKGVKNKPLDIIEHAIAVTRNARVMDPDERIKYFFRCLRNGR